MSASQRRKGQVAERELFALLSDELGFIVRRNVDQARQGGADCIEVPGFAIECKRHQKLARPSWWRQAVRQGVAQGAEPICWYRRNREPWRALLRTVDGGYRDVSWEESVLYVREKLARLHAVYGMAA